MGDEITIGVHILQFGLDFSQVRRICKAAEDLGFDSVTLMDHFRPFTGFCPKNKNLLECWTTLAALAMDTKRVRIGSLVSCASYRNPAMLAKMAATVDHISGGRLKFGVGSGSMTDEFEENGVTLGKPRERIMKLEETIRIVKRMWIEEEATFNGKHYRVSQAVCYPKPVQKPHPPIIVGGGGEKLTLKVVAKLADAWNFGAPPDEYAKKLEVLKKHCVEVGRDFEEIGLSRLAWVILSSDRDVITSSLPRPPENLDRVINAHLIGTPETCIKNMRRSLELGITDFELVFPDTFFSRKDPLNLPNLETMQLFAEAVLPQFK